MCYMNCAFHLVLEMFVLEKNYSQFLCWLFSEKCTFILLNGTWLTHYLVILKLCCNSVFNGNTCSMLYLSCDFLLFSAQIETKLQEITKLTGILKLQDKVSTFTMMFVALMGSSRMTIMVSSVGKKNALELEIVGDNTINSQCLNVTMWTL